MIDTTPLFTDDTIVFGLLMSAIALIFYTESRPTGFWHKFYKIVPGLFMAYIDKLLNKFNKAKQMLIHKRRILKYKLIPFFR